MPKETPGIGEGQVVCFPESVGSAAVPRTIRFFVPVSLEFESIVMKKFRARRGFSLLELLAVVTILGIIAAMVVPRVTTSSQTAKQNVHNHNKATINAAVERYFVNTGDWPANDLSDIGADPNYFPDGLPPNPMSSAPYTIDGTTHRVDTP